MGKKVVFELEIRRKVYDHISKSPGKHEREISRDLGISLSTLDYHLHHLQKRNLIMAVSDGRFSRYYISGEVGVKDKKVIGILRQDVYRKIIMFLLLNPNSPHKNVSDHLDLSPSTMSFHMKRLADLEIVERIKNGREVKYIINEADYTSDLLITYRKSFFDKAVDRFIDAWLEVNPRHARNKDSKKGKDKKKDIKQETKKQKTVSKVKPQKAASK